LFLEPVPEPGKTSGDKNITLSDPLHMVAQAAEPHSCWLTSDPSNEVVNTAWDISQSLDFLALLKAENGQFTTDRRHNQPYWRKGKQYYDWGACGVSDYYHSETVNDERFFTDTKWQLEQCWRLYAGGTTFYGAKRIPQMRKDFTCN